jgi:hypothetical protein
MGYLLNSLGNLPIDTEVKFYAFVINGQWEEPLYQVIDQNFSRIAKSIGSHAVIAKGTEPAEWTREVAEEYLGPNHDQYFHLLPALLITDAHPSQVTEKSLRLLIPLRDVEERFGGWNQFFTLLGGFVQGKSDEFVKKFEARDLVETVNKIVQVKPAMFGIGLNINELFALWRRRRNAGA